MLKNVLDALFDRMEVNEDPGCQGQSIEDGQNLDLITYKSFWFDAQVLAQLLLVLNCYNGSYYY